MFINTSTGNTLTVDVDHASETVQQVIDRISSKEGVSSDIMQLVFNGKQLENNETLAKYAIDKESNVQLVMNLCGGGKVHGSLARAGKVKKQTPKVEKQDKKKKTTGRAKKRIQYYRRFTAAVTGFGGKKVGPNNNAERIRREAGTA